MSEARRKALIKLLEKSGEPLTGTTLAEHLGVSRQVIVQDIAVLRAQGIQIVATSNGYTCPSKIQEGKLIRTIVSKHNGNVEMADELMMIIEYGCKVIDVVVEHPVYGEIVVNLHIATIEDVKRFIENVKRTNAKPLASLTEGEHIHTIEVPSEKVFKILLADLKEKGYVK